MLENRIMWHHLDLLLPYKSVPCFPCKIIQLSGNCHHYVFMCCDLSSVLSWCAKLNCGVCVHTKITVCFFVMQLHCAAEGCPRDKLWFSSKSWCRTQTWWVDSIHCCICFCTNCSQIELQQGGLTIKKLCFCSIECSTGELLSLQKLFLFQLLIRPFFSHKMLSHFIWFFLSFMCSTFWIDSSSKSHLPSISFPFSLSVLLFDSPGCSLGISAAVCCAKHLEDRSERGEFQQRGWRWGRGRGAGGRCQQRGGGGKVGACRRFSLTQPPNCENVFRRSGFLSAGGSGAFPRWAGELSAATLQIYGGQRWAWKDLILLKTIM